MMRVLQPTYTLRVTIKDKMMGTREDSHSFYNGLEGKTGCDQVVAAVREVLSKAGFTFDVQLEKFEHT